MIENKHVKKMLQLLIGHIILTFQKVRHQKKKRFDVIHQKKD